MPDPGKKAINNAGLIAHLAPLLSGPEASALATAARTYRSILIDLQPDSIADAALAFEGCDQAQKLIRWIRTDREPDTSLMNEWTNDIWSAIDNLAAGKLPT